MLISCGSGPSDYIITAPIEPPVVPQVEREPPEERIQSVVDEFLFDCGETYGADVSDIDKILSIVIEDPSTEEKPTRVGVCYASRYADGVLAQGNIVLKDLKSDITFKALVYHELGHCVLGLKHDEQKPYHLMSPQLGNPIVLERDWDILVKDLCLSER